MPTIQNLDTIGEPFTVLSKVDSTNNYAMALLQNQLAMHGSTYFSHYQTAGKGQRGKSWQATEGLNLLQSVVLDASPFNISNPFSLSVIVANACYDFYKTFAGEGTSIKWPNDIYWNDRKAGGILIENLIKGTSWSWAVAGIGININQTSFDDSIPNPISLKQITGKHFDTVQLGRELCTWINKHYKQFLLQGFKPAFEYYNQHLYKKNEAVRLKRNRAAFYCTIKGVSGQGDLLVEGCGWEKFVFGEVEWVLK